MKKIFLCLICVFFICGCGSDKNPVVTMEIKDYGTIEMELYPNVAPNTVANFVNLIEDGFYNENTFHRLVPGFALQGGDPTGTGNGGPGYNIVGEFKENNFNNNLSHVTGIISMARATAPNTAGSQFFIVLSDNYTASLDNKYAAFGKVTKGMDIIKKIEASEEIDDPVTGKLKNNLTINKTTVETFGKKYTVKKVQ